MQGRGWGSPKGRRDRTSPSLGTRTSSPGSMLRTYSAPTTSNATVSEAKIVASPSLPITSGRMRSEEHTSELQSLMRISYDVFCLKKKKHRDGILSWNQSLTITHLDVLSTVLLQHNAIISTRGSAQILIPVYHISQPPLIAYTHYFYSERYEICTRPTTPSY